VLNGDDLLWLKYQVKYDNLKNQTSLKYTTNNTNNTNNLRGEGESEGLFVLDVLGGGGVVLDSFLWPYTEIMQFSIDLNIYPGISRVRIQRVSDVKNIQVKFYKLE
jgi:hypothetical protein